MPQIGLQYLQNYFQGIHQLKIIKIPFRKAGFVLRGQNWPALKSGDSKDQTNTKHLLDLNHHHPSFQLSESLSFYTFPS